MSDRFHAVLAVHTAHRGEVAREAAQRLAHVAGIPLTLFDIAGGSEATVRPPTDQLRTVAEVAAAIRTRDGALLVLDALGGGPPGDQLYDSDAEHLLANVPLPTLIFGPHATLAPTQPVLLIAADGGTACAASVPVAVAWTKTFPSSAVVVGLDAPDPWPSDTTDPVVDPARQLAAALASAGVTVELERRNTLDPVGALIEAAAAVPGGVLVIPAARYRTAVNHWFSTSRRLVRHAPRPVLLAPEPRG
jgi:nucleotide-binding universal stress UspA family protein